MKKYLLTFFYALCSLGALAQFSGSGTGTQSDPYLIFNPIQLNQIRGFLNQSGVYFKLMADIDLTEWIAENNPSQGWQPIGTHASPFKGVLAGGGHTISGLMINRGSTDNVGFFASIDNAKIDNLTLKGSVSGGTNTGGICGECNGTISISNVRLEGQLIGNAYVGGIVGNNQGTLTLSSCQTMTDITVSGSYAGGLIGYSASSHTANLSNCFAYGTVAGNQYVGGLIGAANQHTVSNCGAVMEVTAQEGWAGGIMGSSDQMTSCNDDFPRAINNSFAIGDITSNGDHAGGIVGYSYGYHKGNNIDDGYSISTINNCYYSGNIQGKTNVGGIVGYGHHSCVDKSYAIGTVSGTQNVGGIIGYIPAWNGRPSKITSSVSIHSAINALTSDVGRIYGKMDRGEIGQTGSQTGNLGLGTSRVVLNGVLQTINDDAQHGTSMGRSTLKVRGTYQAIGWNFNDDWNILDTECYPYAKTQMAPPVIESGCSSGSTLVTGKSTNGGTVYLTTNGKTYSTRVNNYHWEIITDPLQSGEQIAVYADDNSQIQSYIVTQEITYAGKGTEADPFRVFTASDLANASGDYYYKLMNDIDLSSYISTKSPSTGWVPIGKDASVMSHFDGDGHTISGLWINSADDYVGLFSNASGAEIKNLHVSIASSKKVKGGNYTGGIIGRCYNGKIENCSVTGTVEGKNNTGGISGADDKTQNLNNKMKGSVSGTVNVGGICGATTEGKVQNAQFDGTVQASSSSAFAGGIAGCNKSAMTQCSSSGSVTATSSGSVAGGIIGKSEAGGSLSNSYSTALITANSFVGGVVGYNYGSVENCYSSGNLKTNVDFGGGVVGYNDGSSATSKHNVALNVKIEVADEKGWASRVTGGLKNGAATPGMDSYAYNDMIISINGVPMKLYDDNLNGTAKSIEELKSMTTYQNLGWDFTNIWTIAEGASLPYLRALSSEGNAMVEMVESYYQANANGAGTFRSAIDAALAKVASGSYKEEDQTTLQLALDAYLAANEVKGIVINPTMEGVSDNDNLLLGWEGTGVRSSNTDNPGRFWSWIGEYNPGISGTFAEQWINDDEICDADMYQTISGLPAGTYVLSAYCIACRKDDDTLPIHGVTFYANDQSVAVSTRNNSPVQYRVIVTIKEGEDLTIGYKVSNTNAHWAVIDNVQLYCLDKTAALEITPKEPSGKCGENVTWSFEQSTGTLTFSGTGDMYDYGWDNLTPWGIYHNQIKKVVVEEGVTNVGAYAFRLFNYPNLIELELASTVKWIKTHAFRDVLGLRNYVFNEGLETIDNFAFGCDDFNMGDVVLPSTLKNMDGNAFRGTTFNSLTVAGENANMKADDLILFSADGNTLIACYRENMTSYVVPDGVKYLVWNVFYKNTTLTSVVLPNTVEDIRSSAFAHCSNLKEITLSSALKYMDVWVFENDPLEKVICPAIVPPTIVTGEDATFKGVDLSKCTLIVPVGSKASYEAAEGWKDFGTIVEDANISPEPEENEPTDISDYDYVLYFSETEVQSGTTSTLSLNLKNAAEDITAIQCDIYLPEGVEWASTIDKRGNKVLTQPTFNTETERTDETYHTITPVTQMSNGAYRVMCYSMQKEVFLDNDGAVLDIPVTISEEMEDGDYSVVIKDIYLTDTKTNQHIVDEVISKLTVFSYTSGDVNADGLINITDIVSVISYILEDAPESFIFKAADVNEDGIINITDIVGIIDIILTDDAPANATLRRRVAALANALPSLTTLEIVPFGIEQGTTSATVTLDMLNPDDEFTAFECSIKLPEGIGWAYTTDRRGNIIYTQPTFNKAADRTDANYHTLSPVTKMSDGTYKVMCYSMQKVEFLDAAGAILDLPLIFAEDLAEGIYEIEVKDIVLTRKDVTDVKPSDYKATVVVGKPAVKSATIYGDVTADAIAMLNARLGANESLGSLDLSSAIAVDGTSAITTANPNAVIYVAEGMSVKNESNVVEGDVCANLVLTDGKPFGPAKTFTVKAGEYSRTLSADTYGTIVLPFTPDAETLKGYTFYELTDVETNALTFDEVSSPVAGKPYVVTSDGTATKMSAEAESTVVIEPAATEADGWTMTGTYESVVFTDADELASLYCISGNQFKQATSKLTMNPFRAYFVGDGSVNSITLRGDDGTTNILNLEGEQAVGQLYDVLGRQVEHAEQGIYIQNGKKVLVK